MQQDEQEKWWEAFEKSLAAPLPSGFALAHIVVHAVGFQDESRRLEYVSEEREYDGPAWSDRYTVASVMGRYGIFPLFPDDIPGEHRDRVKHRVRGGHECIRLFTFLPDSADIKKLVRWNNFRFCAPSGVELYAHVLGWEDSAALPAAHIDFWDDPETARAPGDGEAFSDWIARVTLTEEDLGRFLSDLRITGGSISLMQRMQERAGQEGPSNFLVSGLIPSGTTTLFAGNRKIGKSTAALELAVTVASGGGQWCGFDVPAEMCEGLVVFLCGEDRVVDVNERVTAMAEGKELRRLVVVPHDGTGMAATLRDFEPAHVSLVVVDPLRAYLDGDEDSSDPVSEFFNTLRRFSDRTGAAALVTHHLKKDARPRTLNEVATAIRGSGVIGDRPRVFLGMLRNKDRTVLGIPAPDGNPLHNLRAASMFTGERLLVRDEATQRHLPADTKGSPEKRKALSAEDKARVKATVDDLLATGVRLTRTGREGVYEKTRQELPCMSRQAIREALEDLLAEGHLALAADGRLTAAAPVGAEMEEMLA